MSDTLEQTKNDSQGRNWVLHGLPGQPEHQDQAYRFYVGPLSHVSSSDERALYLRIPEKPHRDAEGRPRHPEQAKWIERTLAEHKIRAKAIWWSHWQFRTVAAAEKFEALLQKLGATLESG